MKRTNDKSQAEGTNSQPLSKPLERAIRVALILLGLMLIAYAVSDHPFYGGPPGFGRAQGFIAGLGAALMLSALLSGRIAVGIFGFAVSSLLMLAVAEIAGEIVLGSGRPIYQYDERLIFKFTPNRTSVMTRSQANGGETITHHINSAGFRGEELKPRGQAKRIVVYGDSFIHASYSSNEETFAAQLGKRLASRSGGPVEVINAGVSSYGPDQIAVRMEDELPRLKPDLVIVSVFLGNDYGDLLRNKMFRLSPDRKLVANPWQLDRKVRESLDLNDRESILVRTLRNLTRSWLSPGDGDTSRLTDMGFLLEEAEREYRSLVVDGNNTVTNTHVDHYSADVTLTPNAASSQFKVALMHEVLRKLRDTAAQQGVPIVLLLIPHPFDVVDNYEWGSVDRKRFPEYDSRNQTRFVENSTRDLNIPSVSLYPLFRASNAKSLYFQSGDDHWNAAGQRLAAEAMADYVIANQALNKVRK